MPQDTKYESITYLFQSKGLVARFIQDRVPEYAYLNLDGALERDENAMSSTYGTVIVDRDPDGTSGGINYYFPNNLVSLSRLVNKSNGNSWRYAADNQGLLYRRMGDLQGPYTQIAFDLSGQPFTAVTNTCFASSIPYLFIADAARMLKDNGTGVPSQIGITPPWQTAGYTPYAPNVLLIEDFLSATGFNPVNTTPSTGNFGSIASTGFANTINNFIYYVAEGVVTIAGISNAFNGVLGVPSAGSAPIALLFDIYSAPSSDQFSAYGVGGTIPYAAVVSYLMRYVAGTVSASTTGSISKTVNLDLSQNNQVTDDDLIVLTMAVTAPNNVQQINVLFDINGSGYVNYYTKSISPQNYQSGITGADDPLTTLANEVYQAGVAGGTVSLSSPSQPSVQVFNRPMVPIEAPAGTVQGGGGTVPRLTPANLSTGAGAFITVYMRRGDFLPVGLAGQQNQTWASITGWKIEIVTNSGGSTVWKFNGLYLQWGAGPSSFGGVGYDYRYTYFNFATGTESNGSPIPESDPQYGYVGTYNPLIVLRQAINVKGVYSADPQVTHVYVYRRGGIYGDNWHYLDQIPNTTGTGYFNYKDIIPDMNQSEQDVLILDNDVPVTSTLPNPIYTTLLNTPTDLPGAIDFYWFYGPIQIQVADPTAVFVPGQIVDVGIPQNLEQVTVQQGGTGQFYAVLRLIHAAGEPVQVFATPAQPVDLVELAYGQMWWAGDPNNPHFLYYSKAEYPENCGPQNYIPVSQPSDPIMAIINFRGTLYAATLTTWYIIVGGGGQTPYAQPTGSKHGLVAKHGWTKTESAIFYQAIDGIREFRGADGAYRSLIVEWLYRNNAQTPLPLVDLNQLGTVTMGYWQNYVYISYPVQE